jgi:hypothetical protein
MDKQLLNAYQIIGEYRKEKGADNDLPEVWSMKAEELYKLQQVMKQLRSVETKLMEELKDISNHESACDGTYELLNYWRKGSVEYGKIPVLKNVDLEVYRKADVECWKLGKI